jgi:hypothetical protein
VTKSHIADQLRTFLRDNFPYPRARDGNEAAIVDALRAAGATVTRLGDAGVPDLLVGYRGSTLLLEIKLPLGARGGKAQRREAEGGAAISPRRK